MASVSVDGERRKLVQRKEDQSMYHEQNHDRIDTAVGLKLALLSHAL